MESQAEQQEPIESLLENEENRRKYPVKRYLDHVATALEEIEEEKSVLVGGLSFQPDHIVERQDIDSGKGISIALSYLEENTEYLDRTTSGYRIDKEKIEELDQEASEVELIPTIKEEEEMLESIIKGLDEDTTYQNIETEFREKINYDITESAIRKRLSKNPDIEMRDGVGKNTYHVRR